MAPLVPGSGLFAGLYFAPLVANLKATNYLVRDYTQGQARLPDLASTGYRFDVGRYNERRRSMYTSSLFDAGREDPWATGTEGSRDIHMGVDIGSKVGTPVCSVADGTIHSAGYNGAELDYGHVVVVEHVWNKRKVWALYGHLDKRSTATKQPGDKVTRGEVIGWMGDTDENGGWPFPHVHFQLSLVRPETHDMPGVVDGASHAEALQVYPDPRMVLGNLYDGSGFFE